MVKPHVLIVDDDEKVRSALFSILDRSGYRVSSCGDGREGLDAFRTDQPDVLIVDVRMPRLDGRAFIETVAAEEPDAVILVLTGHGTVETAVDLMRRGVYSVLTKPCGMEEVLFMVEKALRERRLKERSRELEKRLEISERLAMIGKLAAGVAHELNNPLDGVIRFVKLTLETLVKGSEARDFQEEALRGLNRMSSIVTDLLTFSRNIALEVEEEGLEKLLREAVNDILRTHPQKEMEISYDLAVPDIAVPRGMFQVFQNLVKNAVDAVGEGGRIELRAGVRDGDIFVSVKDDGCGIPEDLRKRVFEPFFTTKEVGRGTGLGLSIVSRIMERFGGAVELESQEGRSTTVTVLLPANAPATRERRDEREPRDAESVHSSR